MNTSQFMDKQIMDLTSSANNNKDKDFIDLMNYPQQEEDEHGANNGIGIKREEIVPSYDFQPIRGGLYQALNLDSTATANTSRVWNSAEHKSNLSSSALRNYGSLDSMEPSKLILGKDRNGSDAAMVSEIDRTMKKYADNLLHVLEGVSAQLTQLETRTRNLESSVDDLKVSVGNNHGSSDGKMRQMENILREVQLGVFILKDKQEILEAQLQLGKMQVSKVDKPSGSQSTARTDSEQQVASAPLQSHIHPPPITFPQSVPPLPPSIVPPPPAPQQNLPPAGQLPNQFPLSHVPSVPQREPFPSLPGQTLDAPNQQYQVPPTQQQQQQPHPAAPPHQPYQPTPQPTFSQPPQSQYSQPPQLPPLQSSLGHLSEERAYIPSQNYPPNLRQPATQPPNISPPSHNYYGAPSHMYESPPGRSNSGFPTGYGPQSGPNEPFPYGGVPSQYGSGSAMKPPQLSSPMVTSGGSGYPQLPTARVLPPAIPTASGVNGGPGSPGAGNRVPNEDVIDKVTSMGFPRDHVRATVRKLTENGQSVDLNVVLDKLMNDGEVQPPRGWFGR